MIAVNTKPSKTQFPGDPVVIVEEPVWMGI